MKIYAKGDMQELVSHSNNVVNFCGLALGWPISIIASVGISFLSIWLKTDYSDFKFLIIIMMIPLLPNLAVFQLNVVNQALNKLKIPAIASILSGVLNLLLAIILVKYFSIWGLAIASIISYSIRNILFTPIYTAVITGQRITSYISGLIKPLLICTFTCFVGVVAQKFFIIDNFIEFVFICIFLSIIYFILILPFFIKSNIDILILKLKKFL